MMEGTPSVEIFLMTQADIDAIHEIETLSFAVPWSRDAFLQELKDNACARYMVLHEDGIPVAYAGMWLVLTEAHITNIAVRPDRRGLGYGEQVTRALIQLAADSGAEVMTLECRKSNLVAQSLYKKLGFQEDGIRRGYYLDNREDAVLMSLTELPEGDPERDPFLIWEDEI